MKKFIILLSLMVSFAMFAEDKAAMEITPEVADLLVVGEFKKAMDLTKDSTLKTELNKLLNTNKLVADSYKDEVGKKITIQIRGKDEKGTLSKIKGTTLYVKVKKGAVTATWPVKVKSLPIEFRMQRIGVSDSLKNLYFGAKAFRQKNYPAAKFYLKQTGEMAKPILEAADKGSKYILSLSGACIKGDLDKTKALIRKGADVNGKIIAHMKNKKTQKLEKLESTILIETIKHHQDDVIKYLIKHGADINKGNSKGVTPLMFAIMYYPKEMDIIEFMLNHQAKVKVKDKSGNTPLTGAVGAGRINAVETLLKHGADVNSPNGKGFTPLMLAVASNNPHMFQLLLDKGADMKKKHPQGWDIFKLDRSRMHPDIKAVLDDISPQVKKKKPAGPGFPIMNRGLNVIPKRR